MLQTVAKKNIYEFCRQSPEEAEQVLGRLLELKEQLTGSNLEVVKKLYDYAEAVRRSVTVRLEENLYKLEDLACVKFLDKTLVENFIQDPANKPVRDDLSLQLSLIYTASGNLYDVPFYSPTELKNIFESNYYDDFILAHTLRQVIAGRAPDESLPHLFDLLAATGWGEAALEVNWEDAFMFALLLRVLWYSFDHLAPEQREFLMENYLFLGVVCGAPVAQILNVFLEADKGREAANRELLFNLLRNNQEMIPRSANLSEGENLSKVINNYLILAQGGESTKGFVQENFINEFYQGQAGREPFVVWLREVLNVAAHLKTVTIAR